MGTKRNITVAIEPGLLKQVRALAARRGRSVSALLADHLHDLVAQDAHYAAARRRAEALLAMRIPLGGVPERRQALHERDRIP